jgi:6-phosphogluconolactonase
MNLRVFDSIADLTAAAARTIEQRRPASVALSGGSTPKPLYERMALSLPSDVTWVLVDERWVPRDDPQSNTAMIERTLFAKTTPERWLPFRTDLRDAAEAAERFETDWNRLALDTLDLVILGCGDDGHTASLFPGTPVLDVEDRIAAAVWVPRLEQWRVTITKPVIREAKLRLVLATGASKAPVIEDVRNGVQHPIAQATEGVETWWFVDRAAAGR